MGETSFEQLFDQEGLYTEAIEQEFSLVYYGKGFTWTDVQNMPVGERALHLRRLQVVLKEEKAAHDKAIAAAASKSSSGKSSVPAPRAPHYRA